LASPNSLSEIVGMMYPLEGSTLGGQVISKHLRRNLGLTPDHGARFFHGYGDDTESFWSAFIEFAEASLTTPETRLQACRYARYLFESLEAFLDVHVS